MDILKAISNVNPEDGVHLCAYCGIQLGENPVDCWNCALAVHEDIATELARVRDAAMPQIGDPVPTPRLHKALADLSPEAKSWPAKNA
jgi:hypothetical protein